MRLVSLGATLCDYLISKNYDLILTARSDNKLANLVSQLQSERRRIQYFPSDFGNTDSFSDEDVLAERVNNVPLKKYASPTEIACTIEALLSDFSNHITGHNIICDGGFTRAY